MQENNQRRKNEQLKNEWNLWCATHLPLKKMISFPNGLIYYCQNSKVLNITYFGHKINEIKQQYNPKLRQYGYLNNLLKSDQIGSNLKQFNHFVDNKIKEHQVPEPKHIETLMNDLNIQSLYQKSYLFDSNILAVDTSIDCNKDIIIAVLTQNMVVYLLTIDGIFIRKIRLVSKNMIGLTMGIGFGVGIEIGMGSDIANSNCHFAIEMGFDAPNHKIWVLIQKKYLFACPLQSANI